jgi:hypothetical protein
VTQTRNRRVGFGPPRPWLGQCLGLDLNPPDGADGREQGTPGFELAAVLGEQGRREAGARPTRACLRLFTGGFHTPDLIEARTLH